MAKSKVPGGWGRERLSATTVECGACCLAILTRLVELLVVLIAMCVGSVVKRSSYRSDPTMKTSLFTAKYFPLPHPTSAPTAPSGCSFKKRSTMGQGWIGLVTCEIKIVGRRTPYSGWMRNEKLFVRRQSAHAELRSLHLGYLILPLFTVSQV